MPRGTNTLALCCCDSYCARSLQGPPQRTPPVPTGGAWQCAALAGAAVLGMPPAAPGSTPCTELPCCQADAFSIWTAAESHLVLVFSCNRPTLSVFHALQISHILSLRLCDAAPRHFFGRRSNAHLASSPLLPFAFAGRLLGRLRRRLPRDGGGNGRDRGNGVRVAGPPDDGSDCSHAHGEHDANTVTSRGH